MADHDETLEPGNDQDTTGTERRSPSPRPTANPASRARRIGGRPTPRPAPRPTPGGQPAPDDQSTDDQATDDQAATDEAPAADRAPKPAPAPEPEAATEAESGSTARPKPASKTERKRKVSPAPTVALDKPAADTEPTEPAAPTEPASGTASRSLPLRWIPAGLLALAAAVLAVFVVIVSHGVYWAKASDSSGAVTTRQEQVLAAAKQCFHDVTSYDYRKLSGLVEKDTACTTGTFRTQLTRSLKTQIIPNAPKLKAVQTAQVNRAGLVSVSADGTQVVVLIYAQLSLSNNSTAKSGRVDVLGAVATMDKVGGTWLISALDTDVGNSLSS